MDEIELAEALRSSIGDFVRRVRVHDRMPAGQAAVLGHLDRGGASTIAGLARLEQVKHQSMTRTVNLLEELGRVAVRADERDARQVLVAITPAGRAALDEERRTRAGAIAAAMREVLDDGEVEVLRRVPAILAKLHP
ncbi:MULTISPECIES: MarR family winged helix-turn-helix transcriptional regulator [Dactylosporangium]|uniref:MarR family transcriptional regulator n=2 Tax=Dactylosporangium TaxID=35753 RepID=A0A9W6KNN1_9ACTN|nr:MULTISPECIES: MarR family transcriptional regulator [Dactylosporangium]UAC00477.1 MarR family transcriptional regulator [Dactylosporangium vinaceum]UWZ48044.1 MarR family transcriptional regulator [Dactylosporangium matsuzakiense]GLL03530.1 MarR family transcriptional regulator [Dactylosporangium matsuzakiense]